MPGTCLIDPDGSWDEFAALGVTSPSENLADFAADAAKLNTPRKYHATVAVRAGSPSRRLLEQRFLGASPAGDQAGAFCARPRAPKGAAALAKRGVVRPPGGPSSFAHRAPGRAPQRDMAIVCSRPQSLDSAMAWHRTAGLSCQLSGALVAK